MDKEINGSIERKKSAYAAGRGGGGLPRTLSPGRSGDPKRHACHRVPVHSARSRRRPPGADPLMAISRRHGGVADLSSAQ